MGCINWAWKIQGLKSNEKVLLLAIADRADKESGVCRIPMSRLCRDSGGWTRQQTNRVANRLADMDLIAIELRYPGTDDTERMFICNLTTIDPEVWRPAEGKGGRRKSTIMSTSAFLNLLRQAFVGTARPDSEDWAYYDTWLCVIKLVEIKKDRLVCKVPDEEFSRKIWKYHELIVKIAQEHISPSVKKLRMFWDRRKPTAN